MENTWALLSQCSPAPEALPAWIAGTAQKSQFTAPINGRAIEWSTKCSSKSEFQGSLLFTCHSLKGGTRQKSRGKNQQARQSGFLCFLHHCPSKVSLKRRTSAALCSYTELPFQVLETHKLVCIFVWSLLIF